MHTSGSSSKLNCLDQVLILKPNISEYISKSKFHTNWGKKAIWHTRLLESLNGVVILLKQG